jgi:ArsR family transcriptional regulator
MEMSTAAAPIFDDLVALGDAIRCRVLLLLDGRELTVAEICSVLQTPQSTVSRHLKALSEGGWVASRPEGTSRLYRLARSERDSSAKRLWQVVRDQIASTAAVREDARRLDRVLALRRTRSQEFFRSAAGRWDRLRDELFGKRFQAAALLNLLDERLVVGDLGCGGGQVAETLAPWVRCVIAVDGSAAMLQAARKRLHGVGNVDLRQGRLEALPIDDDELDVAMIVLALHHTPEPAAVVTEAARVLKPGGRLAVIDMAPHDREAYRQQMGHVWLGFSEPQMFEYFAGAGLGATRLQVLAADPDAQGPTLFAASARKPELDGRAVAIAMRQASAGRSGPAVAGAASEEPRT